jgi:hypothetical protein
MIPITIINSHTTHKNQETSLKLSVYLDRQKVAAKIRGVILRRKTAWITIGQPLFTTTRKKIDTGPKKISAKRNKACTPASTCSCFITKSVKRIAVMIIVARLNNEMRALKRVFGSTIRSNAKAEKPRLASVPSRGVGLSQAAC